MTTTTATEQQNYDALLAGEIPDTLREAVTRDCRGCDAYGEGPDNMLEGDHETDCPKRRPLPLAEAHVAAERWATVEQGWLVHFDQGGVEVHRPVGLGSYHRLEEHYGPDIFSAIGAAFKGGE